jgi:hypothetical protein
MSSREMLGSEYVLDPNKVNRSKGSSKLQLKIKPKHSSSEQSAGKSVQIHSKQAI